MTADSSTRLGRRVKELRINRGLRIADVAEASGLAISTISKVENGQMSLTYDKLLMLSSGLQVSLSELFAEDARAEVPKAGGVPGAVIGRRDISRKGGGAYVKTRWYEYWYVCEDFSRKAMTPILGRTTARTLEEFGPLVHHPGQEFLHVLEGVMEVHTEYYEPTRLEAGDSMYFDSPMGHAYLTVSDKPCRFLTVCSEPRSVEKAGTAEAAEAE